MSEPATKQDLDEAMGVLRGEMSAMEGRVRGELDQIHGELGQIRGEMKAMKTELILEIGAAIAHAANVMIEDVRRQFGVLDDKYG